MRASHTVRRALLGAGLVIGARAALAVVPLQRADVRAGDALRFFADPGIDRAVVASTDLGSLYAVGGCATVLAVAGHRRSAGDVAGVGLLGWVLSQSAKTRVRRARPYEAHGTRRLLRPPTGSSFPSGHATVATAVGTLLADRAGRGPVGTTMRAVGPYVALTRVYAGVHYPTDVVGGVGIGLVLAAVWQGTRARWGRRLVRVAATALGAVRSRRGPVTSTAAGSCRPASDPSPRDGRPPPRSGSMPAPAGR